MTHTLIWNGLCPQCALQSHTDSRMKLNHNDFYECEQCRLQIAVPFAGVQAVVLKKRGLGKFRSKNQYADEQLCGEALTPQSKETFPFGDKALLQSEEELLNYLQSVA